MDPENLEEVLREFLGNLKLVRDDLGEMNLTFDRINDTLDRMLLIDPSKALKEGEKQSSPDYSPKNIDYSPKILAKSVAQDSEKSFRAGTTWDDSIFTPHADILCEGVAKRSFALYNALQHWNDEREKIMADYVTEHGTDGNKVVKAITDFEGTKNWYDKRFLDAIVYHADNLVGLDVDKIIKAGMMWCVGEFELHVLGDQLKTSIENGELTDEIESYSAGYEKFMGQKHVGTFAKLYNFSRDLLDLDNESYGHIESLWFSKSAVSTVDASHFMTSNSLQDLIASGKLYKQVDNKKSWRNFTAMVGYDGLAKMSATEYNVAVQAYTLAKHKGHLNLFADNIEAVVEQGTLIQWSQEIIAGLTEDAIGGDTYERTTA